MALHIQVKMWLFSLGTADYTNPTKNSLDVNMVKQIMTFHDVWMAESSYSQEHLKQNWINRQNILPCERLKADGLIQSSPTLPAWQTSRDGSSSKKEGEGMVSRVRTVFTNAAACMCTCPPLLWPVPNRLWTGRGPQTRDWGSLF